LERDREKLLLISLLVRQYRISSKRLDAGIEHTTSVAWFPEHDRRNKLDCF
jgi:hypothetical protein